MTSSCERFGSRVSRDVAWTLQVLVLAFVIVLISPDTDPDANADTDADTVT